MEFTKAVTGGNLTKKITVDKCGEILNLKEMVNGMMELLQVFADKMTRLVREVGIEGKLSGQARVMNVGEMWKLGSFFKVLQVVANWVLLIGSDR